MFLFGIAERCLIQHEKTRAIVARQELNPTSAIWNINPRVDPRERKWQRYNRMHTAAKGIDEVDKARLFMVRFIVGAQLVVLLLGKRDARRGIWQRKGRGVLERCTLGRQSTGGNELWVDLLGCEIPKPNLRAI